MLYTNPMYAILETDEYFECNIPHHGIQSNPFRILDIQIDDGDARIPQLITHEYPITDAVHEVEVAREPINGHVFYICKSKEMKNMLSKCCQTQHKHGVRQWVPFASGVSSDTEDECTLKTN